MRYELAAYTERGRRTVLAELGALEAATADLPHLEGAQVVLEPVEGSQGQGGGFLTVSAGPRVTVGPGARVTLHELTAGELTADGSPARGAA